MHICFKKRQPSQDFCDSCFPVMSKLTQIVFSLPSPQQVLRKLYIRKTIVYIFYAAKCMDIFLVDYYGVAHWNDYYEALIYLQDADLLPLQSAMRDILMASKILSDGLGGVMTDRGMAERMQLVQSMRYSSIIIAVATVLAVYPFIQKFFVKGVMIGSVKE